MHVWKLLWCCWSVTLANNLNYLNEVILSEFLLMSRSSCAQKALVDIIPECIAVGINSVDPQLKMILAIKLSICEFETSGVIFPDPCREEDYSLCLSQLEKSPQFWTTYSGNFRELSTICYVESLPYERNKILDTYANVTRLYAALLSNMDNAEQNAGNLQVRFDELFQMFEQFKKTTKDHQEHASEFLMTELDSIIQLTGESINTMSMQMYEKLSQEMSNFILELQKDSDIIYGELEALHDNYKIQFEDILDHSLESLSKINFDLVSMEITSKQGLQASNVLQDSLIQNGILSQTIEESLIESLELIENQHYAIRNEFTDSLSIISEKITLEVSSSVDQIEKVLRENLHLVESQINRIQESVELVDELFINVTKKFQVYLNMVEVSIDLISDGYGAVCSSVRNIRNWFILAATFFTVPALLFLSLLPVPIFLNFLSLNPKLLVRFSFLISLGASLVYLLLKLYREESVY